MRIVPVSAHSESLTPSAVTSMVKSIVFLLEEVSARELLMGLVPRIVDPAIETRYLVFEGKSDLEKHLVKRLRGWLIPETLFVVLRDQDAADCVAVKERVMALVEESGRPALVRVACRDLESWVVGDWEAVAQAFDRPRLADQARKAKYREPDRLSRAVYELQKLVPEYQKVDGARRVGPLLDPGRNASVSFQKFCSGLRRLTGRPSETES